MVIIMIHTSDSLLKDIRKLTKAINKATTDEECAELGIKLASKFEDLDVWMSEGEYPPIE